MLVVDHDYGSYELRVLAAAGSLRLPGVRSSL
jgi:hypothetical protein